MIKVSTNKYKKKNFNKKKDLIRFVDPIILILFNDDKIIIKKNKRSDKLGRFNFILILFINKKIKVVKRKKMILRLTIKLPRTKDIGKK